uniref:Uncharacterized protein n=1 Tax=Tanacetum cinerariifolium TaxID=118510 RepID=A0A6L2L8Z9_TANCI|nr:hypothetical protein [Tanacetum cinerariifolium]
MGLKKKTVMVTSDPLALIAENTKVSKRKEKVVVSSDSERSDADDFSELKKITALLAKAFNRRKFYSKPTNNNLRTSSTSQSANKKQEFVKSDDKKEGHFAKDCKKVKVKNYEYYKTKMLLAKKDKDEQVILDEDQAWMEFSSDFDQEINANIVFMAQIEKVLSDSETSSSSADDKISKVSYYLSESKSKSEYETSDYYDNTTTYGLFVNDNDDQEIFHDCKNFPKNLIEFQINHNESAVDHNDSEGIYKLCDSFDENNLFIFDDESVRISPVSKMPFKKKPRDSMNICLWINNSGCSKHMTGELRTSPRVPSNFDDGNAALLKRLTSRSIISTDSLFQQTSSLKPYVPTMILEKIIIDLEDEVKIKVKMIVMWLKKSDKVENSKVIAPGLFKLSVPQRVSPISISKTFCDSKNVESKLKRKRRKRKSSKQNDKQVNNDVSLANSDFVHFLDLDTFSGVRRPKHSGVIWKQKGSSNTFNVDLSSVSISKLNKDVKRYSRKDLLSCNNSHLGETSIAYDCNEAMCNTPKNVSQRKYVSGVLLHNTIAHDIRERPLNVV